MLLVGLIAWMAYRLVDSGNMQLIGGTVSVIILAAVFLVVFALFMVLISFLRQLVVRFAAIEDAGVGESFRKGWALFKSRFGNTFITGLVLIGVGMAFGFAMILAAFLLIPAYALMAVPGALVAAIPGGLAFWLTTLFAGPPALAVIVALLVAIPILIAIAMSPLSFLSGMFAVFTSAVWTLAFRQMKVAMLPLPVIPDLPPALPE